MMRLSVRGIWSITLLLLTICGIKANAQGSLPTGWSDGDVGTVGVAGNASYASGVFTEQAGGSSFLSASTDAFHFAYQPLSGDGTIVARVVSTSSTNAQAGVMIRETLSSSS